MRKADEARMDSRFQRFASAGAVGLVLLAVATAGLASAAPSLGIYTRNVTTGELLKAGSLAPHGEWTLRIKVRGLSLDARGQGLVPERAVWTASKVRVSDTPGSASIFCGATVKGTYSWKRIGSKLSFRLVRDPCTDRAGVLLGVWKKSA